MFHISTGCVSRVHLKKSEVWKVEVVTEKKPQLNPAHRYTFFVLKRRWLARSYFTGLKNKSNGIFSRWTFNLEILTIQLPCSWMSLFLNVIGFFWRRTRDCRIETRAKKMTAVFKKKWIKKIWIYWCLFARIFFSIWPKLSTSGLSHTTSLALLTSQTTQLRHLTHKITT